MSCFVQNIENTFQYDMENKFPFYTISKTSRQKLKRNLISKTKDTREHCSPGA